MKTLHKFIKSDARNIKKLEDNSIDLVVTSPPYPMVKMWDEIMIKKESEDIAKDSDYKKMTAILDGVWKEMSRVVKPGGMMAINMGDATRSNNKGFKLYSNAMPIVESCTKYGFEQLPGIIWSKPTNSPNKFLGSGMYPVMAYVTLEHEHILIFRNGKPRKFTKEEMVNRRESAFFWEERNEWFSDIWKVTGTRQNIKGLSRERNAAYPVEIPLRLINMFSVKGDTVLDPFLGTGTTAIAAAASERNSVGVDLMTDFVDVSENRLLKGKNEINKTIFKRIDKHMEFLKDSKNKKDFIKNKNHKFLVKTKWETEIVFNEIDTIKKANSSIEVTYKKIED